MHAQPVVTPRIVISAPSSGIESGIDIPTNASMPTTGAYRIHGAQAKENARIDSYGNPTIYPGMYTTHSRGTEASPTPPQTNDALAIWAAGGHDGSPGTLQAARARITAEATNNWSSGATGTQLRFWTTANASGTPTARWTIQNDGFLMPGATSTYSIGNSSLRVLELWVGGIDVNNIQVHNTATFDSNLTVVGETKTAGLWVTSYTKGDFIPVGADATYDLGSATYRWQDLHVFALYANSVQSNLLPTTLTYTLGDGSHYWQGLYTDDIFINSGGRVTGDLTPISNATYNLGNNSLKWNAYLYDLTVTNSIVANGSVGITTTMTVAKSGGGTCRFVINFGVITGNPDGC